METSQAGIDLIKKYEGCRLVAYMDSVGVWTIGYGSTVDVAPGMQITVVQAEERLKLDVNDAERCVNDCVTVPLSQGEFDALVSFVFNEGPGRKKSTNGPNDPGKDGFKTLKNGDPSTMLRLLNEDDKDGASREFRKWDKAGGQVLAGLTKRRYEESKMFEIS